MPRQAQRGIMLMGRAARCSKVIAAGWCNKELPKFKGTVYVLKASRQPGLHPYFSPWSIKNGSFLPLPQVFQLVSSDPATTGCVTGEGCDR